MRILIVVPRQDLTTGNWISAERFRAGLTARGHRVTIRDTPLQAEAGLRTSLLEDRPDVTLLLHAYRSGLPWSQISTGLDIPHVVMLTGTDVNQGLNDPQQAPLIRCILDQAAAIVHQNPLLADELVSRLPSTATLLRHVAAGTILGTEPYDVRRKHDLPADRLLFLCPAGVRPVKGLIELLELFDNVDADALRLVVAFCGPILDATYAERFLGLVAEREWAHYLGVIPSTAMASAMREADVIINNSSSEGLSNALLEATVIGRPILARNIPGNAAIVVDGVNGLLYDDASFPTCVRQLAQSPQRSMQLSKPDVDLYSPTREAQQLAEVLKQACKEDRET